MGLHRFLSTLLGMTFFPLNSTLDMIQLGQIMTTPHTHTHTANKENHGSFVICPEINWPVGAVTPQT